MTVYELAKWVIENAYDKWLTTIVFLCIIFRVRLIDISAIKRKSEEDKE